MGYLCGNVESQNGKFRSDLFQLFDFVALSKKTTIGVQACSAVDGEVLQHQFKMLDNKNLPRVLQAGWRVMLICFWPWVKEGKRNEVRLFEWYCDKWIEDVKL